MKVRPKRLALVGSLLLAISIWWMLSPGREPRYKGKALSTWLAMDDPYRFMVNPDDANHYPSFEVVEAVRAIGTNGIPFYLKWLDVRRKPWKDKLLDQVSRLPGTMALDVFGSRVGSLIWNDGAIGMRAIEGFQILGTNASCAAPALVHRIKTAKPPEEAIGPIYALGYIGEEGLPTLMEILDDKRNADDVRSTAAFAIGYMPPLGERRRSVVEALVRCLNENTAASGGAAASLGNFAAEPDLVVPALIAALRNPGFSGHDRVAAALGNFGESARPAVPALIEALKYPLPYTVEEATAALKKIAPEALEQGK